MGRKRVLLAVSARGRIGPITKGAKEKKGKNGLRTLQGEEEQFGGGRMDPCCNSCNGFGPRYGSPNTKRKGGGNQAQQKKK